MIHVTRIVHITPGGELNRILAETDAADIELVRGGMRYRLNRIDPESNAGAGSHDPASAIAGMRAAAGAWSAIDPDAVKSFIRRAREEGSRSPERP